MENTANILVANWTTEMNVANPSAIAGNRRKLLFIDGGLSAFYFYRKFFAWQSANHPKVLRDTVSIPAALLPDR